MYPPTSVVFSLSQHSFMMPECLFNDEDECLVQLFLQYLQQGGLIKAALSCVSVLYLVVAVGVREGAIER
jgi:predicted MarR family transcription regulator